MATVTTSTATLNAELQYVCSKCGTPNTVQTTIQAFAKNPDKASARMQNILSELASNDLSRRYTHANLKCKCAKCRHAEPWTKLDFYKLDSQILAWSIVCGLIYLTQGLQPIMDHFRFPRLYPLGSCIMISLFWLVIFLPPVLIYVRKKILAATSAKKIAALPKASLPVIRIQRSAAPSRDDIMARINDRMNNKL